MQVPMGKNYILQDPSIVADVIDEAIASVCALLSHNQLGREWTPYHMYQKFMDFSLINRSKRMMWFPFHFGHPNISGVELPTLTKRFAEGNPCLLFYILVYYNFIMFVFVILFLGNSAYFS
jgi:hypothetical protein